MARQDQGYMFRTSGSAAVDPKYNDQRESVARPLPIEEPQPQKQPRPQRAPRPKRKPAARQRMEVSLTGVVGFAMAGIMLVMVIFGYAQVYASAAQVSELEDQVQVLQEQQERLQNQYDTSINLADIEARAKELGMHQPTAKQIINIQIPAEDVTVVTEKSSTNPFQAVWQAIMDTARDLWAYLR